MVKNRVIFTLLLDKGKYMLSRNFRLQEVGDLSWLRENYDFDAIAYSIDELVVLNVERGEKDVESFSTHLAELVHNCFMPVAAGGGIMNMEDAFTILNAGADKLVINTNLFRNQGLVRELVTVFGSQCVIASIDYRLKDGANMVYIGNGTEETGYSVDEAIDLAIGLGVGEIYLTSMDKDGTGQGLDIAVLKAAHARSAVQIIGSGGIGQYDQFVEGMQKAGLNAVSTANLFYFMADGLSEARDVVKKNEIRLADWETGFFVNPLVNSNNSEY